MTDNLDGKVALVSGSTKGIGRTVVRNLAERGADVIVNGRSRDTGEELVAELEREMDVNAYFGQADINDYDQVEAMIEDAVDKMGSLDVVVANGAAGSGPPAHFFREMAPDDLVAFCQTHLINRLYLAKAALEPMITSGGGRIVNITTDAGRVPTPGELGPGMAGAGLMMATRVLANECSRWDITVNAVALTVTQDTELLKQLEGEAEISSVFQKAVERQSFPLTSDDVADIVAFLAGADGSRPITGQTISVTGGVSY